MEGRSSSIGASQAISSVGSRCRQSTRSPRRKRWPQRTAPTRALSAKRRSREDCADEQVDKEAWYWPACARVATQRCGLNQRDIVPVLERTQSRTAIRRQMPTSDRLPGGPPIRPVPRDSPLFSAACDPQMKTFASNRRIRGRTVSPSWMAPALRAEKVDAPRGKR